MPEHWTTARLRRWSELSRRDRRMLLRAWVVVAAVRGALWCCRLSTTRRMAAAAAGKPRPGAVDELARAVNAVSRCVPRATCLTQAIALHALLRRSNHGAQVEIGVATAPQFEAHAWVQCDGRTVLGGASTGRYTPVWTWD